MIKIKKDLARPMGEKKKKKEKQMSQAIVT